MKIPKYESKKVEFKSTFNHDVIVALVAFANADGGDVKTIAHGSRSY